MEQSGIGATQLTAASLDNTGGKLATNGSTLTITANRLSNEQGQIQHAGTDNFNLNATGTITNVSGSIGRSIGTVLLLPSLFNAKMKEKENEVKPDAKERKKEE